MFITIVQAFYILHVYVCVHVYVFLSKSGTYFLIQMARDVRSYNVTSVRTIVSHVSFLERYCFFIANSRPVEFPTNFVCYSVSKNLTCNRDFLREFGWALVPS